MRITYKEIWLSVCLVSITLISLVTTNAAASSQAGRVLAFGNNEYGECNVDDWEDIIQVAGGWGHTVGLKKDGTVIATGLNEDGQCNLDDWTNIVQIAAGFYHTVGLKKDGTVIATGLNEDGQCNLDDWTNIVQVAAGEYHTVGLKKNGTVVVKGPRKWRHDYGQGKTEQWENIIKVAAGLYQTMGIKNDGTVIAIGEHCIDMENCHEWRNIVQVCCGGNHLVAVAADGTLRGYLYDGHKSTDDWKDIAQIAVAAGGGGIGLKRDGTTVAIAGYEHPPIRIEWKNIVQVSAGGRHMLGLKK